MALTKDAFTSCRIDSLTDLKLLRVGQLIPRLPFPVTTHINTMQRTSALERTCQHPLSLRG